MSEQNLNESINKAFQYVINVYGQGKTIIIDLERMILEKDFNLIPVRNSNGATISRDFSADTLEWIPQYIVRWYSLARNNQADLILGTSVLFFDKTMNKQFKPLLIIGLFEKKDIIIVPQRSDYNTWWIYNAWFEDGPEAKTAGQLYSFNSQYGDESFYWYKSVKLYAWEITGIHSVADISEIRNKIIELL